jgi:protein-tyrosine phosphatase
VTSDYTDSHCHLVPGIDDGAGSFDEALEMAEALAAAGFSRIWCTPHRITGAYDTDPIVIRELVRDLQQRLTRAGIPLRLAPATEYYFDEFLLSALDHPLPLNETMLLVEFPPSAIPTVVPSVLQQLLSSGYTPLIAHPERSPVFALPEAPSPTGDYSLLTLLRALVIGKRREEPEPETELPPLLIQLRSMGCRFQGNIGSFAGIYGAAAKENALLFLREGVYDCLGSDSHRPNQLATWLVEGLGVIREIVGPSGMKRLLQVKQWPAGTP